MTVGRVGGPIVMMVTDGVRLAARLSIPVSPPAMTAALVDQIRCAAEAGVDLIQIREPRLHDAALTVLVRAALQATRGTEARILVNGRPDIAIATGAQGVHLPAKGLPAARVRKLMPRPAVVGVSVHAPAPDVSPDAADYLVFGAVFQTRSKPRGHAVAGLTGLGATTASTTLPVLAIGGVSISRLHEIADAGAAGIAAIDLFLPEPAGPTRQSLRKIVESVREAFDSAWGVS
jgi:thiamine-phosphate pyrophosphorylase